MLKLQAQIRVKGYTKTGEKLTADAPIPAHSSSERMSTMPLQISRSSNMTTLICDTPEPTSFNPNSPLRSSHDLIVAVDGSESSIATARDAGRLANEWGCHLHLVSVLPPIDSYGTRPEGNESRSQVDDLRTQLRDFAIRRIVDSLHCTNDWSHEVVAGTLPEALVKAADRRGACVILWRGSSSPA